MEKMINNTKTVYGAGYLVLETDSSAAIDTAALGMLENNSIHGLLPFTVSQFDRRLTARFETGSYITVSELLKSTVSMDEIITVADTVMNVFEDAESWLISPESVITDFDLMFYDEENRKLHMCIMPFVSEYSGTGTPEEFLRKFIREVKFDSSENCEYIGKMLGYLNSCSQFSISEFRKITGGYSPEKSCTAEIPQPAEKICEEKETERSERISSAVSEPPVRRNYMMPADGLADCEDEYSEPENRQGFLSRLFGKPKKDSDRNEFSFPESGNYGCDSNGEIIFPEAYGNETVVLKRSRESSPYLLRVCSNEKIELTRNRFRIGTEKKSVDYCIDDNCAVSRVHAEILKKHNAFYITDRNSTNHTYVDNQIVKKGREIKIQNSSRIKLADEEFVFCI